jgi:hypothetical protein
MSLVDNIEAYGVNGLNGNGPWTAGGDFSVQAGVTKTGNRAIMADIDSDSADAGFAAEGDGKQVFYFRTDEDGTTNPPATYGETNLREGVNTKIALKFQGGDILIYGAAAGWDTLIAGHAVNTWIKIEIQWRTSDNKVRFFIDDNLEQDWMASRGLAWTNIDTIRLGVSTVAGAKSYWDDFSDPNAPTFDAILKRWTGAAWVKALLKRWSGAAWKDQDDEQLKYYDGAAWKDVDAGG